MRRVYVLARMRCMQLCISTLFFSSSFSCCSVGPAPRARPLRPFIAVDIVYDIGPAQRRVQMTRANSHGDANAARTRRDPVFGTEYKGPLSGLQTADADAMGPE